MSLSSYRKYRAVGPFAYYARRRKIMRVGVLVFLAAIVGAIYSLSV